MPALDTLLERLEASIGRELLEAFRAMQAGLAIGILERLIRAGEIERAVTTIKWELLRNALATGQQGLTEVREQGWQDAADQLPAAIKKRFPVALSFAADAQANPGALERLVRQDLSRIQQISKESQDAIRQVIDRGIRAGLNPRAIARDIRDLIGVNRPQAAALAKLRARLLADAHQEVELAIARGRGRVSARAEMTRHVTRINRILLKRKRAMIATRAETIARTEVMTALNDGKRAQWDRLVRDGVINPQDWEQEWVIADDERTCPQCEPFDGQRAPIGGFFVSTDFTTSPGPPLHPRCRCVPRLVLAGFRRGQSTPAQRRREPTPPLPEEAFDLDITTQPNVRQSLVTEDPAQAGARVAFEEKVETASIEYGYARLADGTERRYKGNRNSIGFGPRQQADLMNAPILIHNHPNATPFSGADVHLASVLRIHTMRVVGRDRHGPVSYEVDVGESPHARGAAEVADRLYRQLFPKEEAIFRAKMAAGQDPLEAAKDALTEILHEVWTRVAQQFGFRYIRRR